MATVSAATPPAAPVVEESFEDAFAKMMREESGTAAPPPETPAPAPTAEAPAEPAPAEGETTELEGLTEEEKLAAANGGEPPAPEPTATATDDALARLADMLGERQRTQPQPQPQPQPVQPQSPYSAEEQATLTQFYNDFPDVAKALTIERRAEYQALTTHIFQQVGAYFAPRLALLEQLADRTVYTDLSQRVPDYDVTRDKVLAWVNTQPAYLQAAYNNVIQQGTVDEITDLFDRYRAATGTPAPTGGIAPAQGNRAPAAPKAPELSPAVRNAAERLAPVSSKRSAPTQQAPLDFDSAFDQFAKTG